MRLRVFVVAIAAAVLLGLSATAAFADSCLNVSRAAPTSGGSGPAGNWVWLPSIGVPVEAWGFAPPGGPESFEAGAPGANGNYTNGRTESLLGMSATCTSGVNDGRQTEHGIQTGCL
jgi:hypothetical protein